MHPCSPVSLPTQPCHALPCPCLTAALCCLCCAVADPCEPRRPQQPHLQGKCPGGHGTVRCAARPPTAAQNDLHIATKAPACCCCCWPPAQACKGPAQPSTCVPCALWCRFKGLTAEDHLVYQCIQSTGNMGGHMSTGGEHGGRGTAFACEMAAQTPLWLWAVDWLALYSTHVLLARACAPWGRGRQLTGQT